MKKNSLNKGLIFTLVLMLSCSIFISCSKDDDLAVVEPTTSTSPKSLYFYGGDAEFEQLQGVEMTRITNEKQLNGISKTVGDSYALFVGKDIDVRSGLIDNLRNSGVLVTQLQQESSVPKKSPSLTKLIKKGVSNSNSKNSSGAKESINENSLIFISYLAVNGDHKILGSIFDNMKEAVPKILQWRQEKVEGSKNNSTSESFASKSSGAALDLDLEWNNVGYFSVNTETFFKETDGYMINNNGNLSEYASMFIFEHKISATPITPWTVENIQVIQKPISSSPVDFSLRAFSPLNSSNGVLDGSSGSDSYGYGVSSGFGLDGPSIGASNDWSYSTDWSIPACQVSTYHNLAQELFHVAYNVHYSGTWSGDTVTAENYTYYANNGYPVKPYFVLPYDHPSSYFISMASTTNPNSINKDILINLHRESRRIHIYYFNGYFIDPNNPVLHFSFEW